MHNLSCSERRFLASGGLRQPGLTAHHRPPSNSIPHSPKHFPLSPNPFPAIHPLFFARSKFSSWPGCVAVVVKLSSRRPIKPCGVTPYGDGSVGRPRNRFRNVGRSLGDTRQLAPSEQKATQRDRLPFSVLREQRVEALAMPVSHLRAVHLARRCSIHRRPSHVRQRGDGGRPVQQWTSAVRNVLNE